MPGGPGTEPHAGPIVLLLHPGWYEKGPGGTRDISDAGRETQLFSQCPGSERPRRHGWACVLQWVALARGWMRPCSPVMGDSNQWPTRPVKGGTVSLLGVFTPNFSVMLEGWTQRVYFLAVSFFFFLLKKRAHLQPKTSMRFSCKRGFLVICWVTRQFVLSLRASHQPLLLTREPMSDT